MLLAACATAAATGCGGKVPVAKPASSRVDVPLRVLWVGIEDETEALARAWGAVAQQSLKFDLISFDRADTSGLSELINERVKKNDLIVVPLCVVPELHANKTVVQPAKADLDAADENIGRLYAAVRSGAAQFASELIGTPLGARLPALFSDESVAALESWADYDQWVEKDLGGAAAEPLSAGWAGAMFLWRASTTIETGWLFSTNGFTPAITTEPYVEVLAQLVTTMKRYGGKRLNPQEVWSKLAEGKIRGGIGFQMASQSDELDISVQNLPGAQQNRVLLDPFSPVALISSGCRQSGASRKFIDWLAGGDGSEGIRKQVDRLSVTRMASATDGESRQQSTSQYNRWLRRRLTTPSNLPSLQLVSAGEYYRVLDEQIGKCLDGDVKPAEALQVVSQKWQAVTDRVGVTLQTSIWRQAQGMRG